MTRIEPHVCPRILEGFDDPTFGPEQWERLLHVSGVDIVYLTWHWLRAWWESFRQGELLLVAVEREGQIVALAPFFAEHGMILFAGSGDLADNHDFIGDISDPEVLDALLKTAMESVPDFLGFKLLYVPAGSHTGNLLEEAADRLGLTCYNEWEMPALMLDLAGQPEAAWAAANKKRLLKCEGFFHREGSLEVLHLQDGKAILPHLEAFFKQSIDRWTLKSKSSFFQDPLHCGFYERLTQIAAHTGWLRFTRINWNGQPIAFHFGYCYRGRFFWNESSFAIDLARHSPGQVLIRHLLLEALEEEAHTFDFGSVEYDWKRRFAAHTDHRQTWGLYPAAEEGQG